MIRSGVDRHRPLSAISVERTQDPGWPADPGRGLLAGCHRGSAGRPGLGLNVLVAPNGGATMVREPAAANGVYV
jgi:hypothetical protein